MATKSASDSTDIIVNSRPHADCPAIGQSDIKLLIDHKIKEASKNGVDWLRLSLAALPFLVAFGVYCANLNTRLAVVELRQSEITEIKQDIKQLRQEITNLTIAIQNSK